MRTSATDRLWRVRPVGRVPGHFRRLVRVSAADRGVFIAVWNLHPQSKGYDIWGGAVSAKLEALMQ